MARKPVRSAGVISGLHYDLHRRVLTVQGAHGQPTRRFLRVPPEVFYGMPNGTNAENFVQMKLHGVYAQEVEEAPPLYCFSWINKTVTRLLQDPDAPADIWYLRDDDPTAFPDDENERHELFKRTFGLRPPDAQMAAEFALPAEPEVAGIPEPKAARRSRKNKPALEAGAEPPVKHHPITGAVAEPFVNALGLPV